MPGANRGDRPVRTAAKPSLSDYRIQAPEGLRGKTRRLTSFCRRNPTRYLALVGFLLLSGPERGLASADTTCDAAAAHAARESRVPLPVLQAVTRVETGRRRGGRLVPWPWTVNMEGTGRWFDNRADALDYVRRNFDRGARSFDIGCFQINFKWHGSAFGSINDMFDPIQNARYAAAFLTRLEAELGGWSKAAGAFHSRTPVHARPYRARFERVRATLPRPPGQGRRNPSPEGAATARAGFRAGTLPLVDGQTRTAATGSLVPVQETHSRAFIALSPSIEP